MTPIDPVPQAPLEPGDAGGLRPAGPGWYVVNVADAHWQNDGGVAYCSFEGDPRFARYGVNVTVMQPGEPSAMYHREAWEDESFLVLEGEAVLVIEGEERVVRVGDFIHCPVGTAHVLVGGGAGPCAVLMLGSRGASPADEAFGVYEVDPAAARHGASVEHETTDPSVAYAGRPDFAPGAPRWTPGAS